MTLRIVIGEDQALLREGLRRLLDESGFEVVATAASCDDVLRKSRAHRPDVVLTDLRMPPDHSDEGLRVAAGLSETDPEIGVLILSQFAEPAIAAELLELRRTGAGYLLKDRVGDLEVLRDALHRVAAGGTVVDRSLVAPLLTRRGLHDPLGELTARERDVLALMAEGRSNAAICSQLFLSPKTVESHVRSVFMKLDLPPSGDDSRRVLAVLRWLRAQRHADARPPRAPGSTP